MLLGLYPSSRTQSRYSPPPSSTTMSTRDSSSKHSPVAALASLEYLQTQRRGSITDPFLHAAHIIPTPKQSSSLRPPHEQPSSSSSSAVSSRHMDSNLDRELPEPRPMSPYTFGNATPRPNELRKLLHSPPREQPIHRSTTRDSPDSSRTRSGELYRTITYCENNLMLLRDNCLCKRT